MSLGDYMANRAVSNTGPLIHLYEIKLLEVLDIFSSVVIPFAVKTELDKFKVKIPNKIKIINLEGNSKDTVFLLSNQYSLDIGEASAISLAIQEKADYFLTDDLEAREVARKYGLKVHGSIGIVLRAFKDKLIDKNMALNKIKSLRDNSSLYITKDLIDYILNEIERFKE